MAKSDCVGCIHSVVCKHRSRNEQPWIVEHCKLAAREERPHGKWTKRSDGFYKCPFCCYSDRSRSNFCPNCGADMREEGDEK